MKNTDLHTHSYYSDGQMSPRSLVNLAKRRGIKNLALTDHNSVNGVKEAIAQGKRMDVNIIPAIEIRASGGEVLGYFIDVQDEELISKIEKDNKIMQTMLEDWCNRLSNNGYDINFQELKENFPEAKGNLNEGHVIFPLYFKGNEKSTFKLAEKLYRKKKTRPKEIKEMSMIKAIKLIKNARGVPVIAHPWLSNTEENFKKMKKYVKAGLKGIEINNGDRSPLRDKHIIKRMKRTAKKFDLIMTSGSDYHGEDIIKLMPGNHNLGKNNCDEKVVQELKSFSKVL